MEGSATTARFQWQDYLIFSLVLLLSCSFGLYYGIQDKRRKQDTLENFLLAGRRMHLLPVSFSMFVSWLSAISFLGDPVEVYYHGVLYWVIGIGYCLAIIPVAQYFAPRFRRMQMYSAYEYLEKRYNVSVRLLTSIIQGIYGGLYCGFVLYGPAISLSQVTGISMWLSTVGVGLVCVFYTTLGGMKAVLWADTVQTFIMVIGLVAVTIRGCTVVGGIGKVWDVAQRRGRINVFDLDPNPFKRATVWSYLIGGFFRVLGPYISAQTFIQRYSTLKSDRDTTIAVYLNIPLFIAFVSLFSLFGLVMVAFYDGCDPLLSGKIQKKDQLVPLVVIELLGFLPGVPGLFLGSLFAASLSSLSSFVNSLSVTLLKDIVDPVYNKCHQKPLSDKLALTLSKAFCVVLGCLFIGLSLIILNMKDGTIFSVSLSLAGVLQGPTLSLFVFGMLVYFIDTKSALVAALTSLGILTWWCLGNFISPPSTPTSSVLDLGVENCSATVYNVSLLAADVMNTSFGYKALDVLPTNATKPLDFQDGSFTLSTLYGLSPLLYSPVGFILFTIIAVTMGLITEFVCKKNQVDRYKMASKHVAEDVKGHNMDQPHEVTPMNA